MTYPYHPNVCVLSDFYTVLFWYYSIFIYDFLRLQHNQPKRWQKKEVEDFLEITFLQLKLHGLYFYAQYNRFSTIVKKYVPYTQIVIWLPHNMSDQFIFYNINLMATLCIYSCLRYKYGLPKCGIFTMVDNELFTTVKSSVAIFLSDKIVFRWLIKLGFKSILTYYISIK